MGSRRFLVDAESLPDLPGMMLATIEALGSLGGSASIQELDEKVIELEGVSEHEQALTMPGDKYRPRVNYYLAWARTYLKRGGALLNSSRGVWSLTEAGSKISEIEQTRAIYEQVTLEERERTKAKKDAAKGLKSDIAEAAESGEPEDSEAWRSQLLAALIGMKADAFERLSQRLLREAGFTKVEVRGKTGDGGIDGLGILRVNLVTFQVYFQCKKWQGNVGSKEIRDFRGAVQGRADKGLFITTGHFSTQASDEATRDGAIAIDLIDGDRLCDLLKQHGLGVHTKMIEQVSVDSGWFQTL
jgi:restriction system protein